MDADRKGHHGLVGMAVMALAALLGACGADSPGGAVFQSKAGVMTVGTPTAGLNTCMSCHADTTATWMKTRHANVNSSPSFTTGAACTVCHDKTGDSQQLTPLRMVAACEACHSGGKMHTDAGGAGPIGFTTLTSSVLGSVPVSEQFATCTYCHELLDSTGTGTAVTKTPGFHLTNSTLNIQDTHFGKPQRYSSSGSSAVSSTTIPAVNGYAMDYSSEKVCIDCHNPHGVVDINQEWAQSAHSDRFGTGAGYFTGAWARSNWSCAITSASTVTLGCGTSDRRFCQRCHTTSGFVTYADALRSGNIQRAKRMSRGLEALVTYNATSYWAPEMLKCNGCHTDYKGSLRNPGAITADYDYSTVTTAGTGTSFVETITYFAKASTAYPDISASNICVTCHLGRESGDTLKALNDSSMLTAGIISFFDFSNNSLVSGHDLTAAGTMFRASGYEYSDRSYENLTTYRHDQIGSVSVPNSGKSGPCVGCHMSRPNGNGDHLFLPVTRSTVTIGEIVNIASEICIFCHTVSGAGGLEELMNERKTELAESLEAVIYVLDKRGFGIRSGTPYPVRVSTGPTGSGGTVDVTNGSTTVTGTGTQWVTAPSGTVITAGTDKDYFKVDNDGTYYQITAATDTTLTLATPYAGSPATGQKYTIIVSGRANSSKNWLTQAGTGITPATSSDTDTTGNTTGKNNMGAVFNVALLEGDPGAYVHNRMYAKRLLYDAIDWADDNRMNFSVGTTLNNISSSAVFKTGAMKYLLPYGVLSIPAERP